MSINLVYNRRCPAVVDGRRHQRERACLQCLPASELPRLGLIWGCPRAVDPMYGVEGS